ncbi:MAG: hypothetical protein ACO1RT_11615 [Planctomycetaceae bacterium]
MTTKDYKSTGYDIQAAMVDLATRYPDKARRPRFIQWGEHQVMTIYEWQVPITGKVSIEFVDASTGVRQGFDVKTNNGSILVDGKYVDHLRTWYDPSLDNSVSYAYECSDGLLKFWNVYERTWPDGTTTEEKWTGNSGFYVEEISETERIFHCSHGAVTEPTFDCLVVRVRIRRS